MDIGDRLQDTGGGVYAIAMLRHLPRLLVYLLVALGANPAMADTIQDREVLWESKALTCITDGGKIAFPSKYTGETAQPCDDGDMTLFNGLLCAAGDDRGCTGVAESQDPVSGEWFRSPRIRLHGNDRGGSSFSPDMALGVELYLVKTHDIERAHKWMLWLNGHVACTLELFGACVTRALPRLCTDDAKDKGCTMRPGDAAQLSATLSYLQRNFGLEALPDGRLRGYLGTFAGYGPAITDIDARVNKPGFSQHLTAVSVMLMRMMGQKDSRLDAAAANLAERNTGNAFFLYLAEGSTDRVRALVLSKCPISSNLPTPPLNQWQWEREEADQAWLHSCYWDCIFMAKLLQ
jgi:hypothetical protein